MEKNVEKWRSISVMTRRRLLFALTSVIALGVPRQSEAYVGLFQPFAFGYVTDAHLATGRADTYKLLQESQLFLQDVVKSLNNERLDFVIFGGDQVEGPGKDDSNWQLFLDVAQSLSAPWNFVLGEADLMGPGVVDKMRTYGPDWKGKGIETKTPYWSHDPLGGVHIIGLDTSRRDATYGEISNKQLEWLKDDLARHQRRFTIVFSHHPLLAPPPYDGGPPWDDYITHQGASAREVLGTSKYVRLAVNGHLHVSKVQQERDIWYVSSPSLNVYPCAYQIFRVTPETITIETYQVNFPALVKKARKQLETSTLAFQFNNARPALFLDVAEGKDLDTNVILPLVPGKALQPLGKKKRQKAKRERPKARKTDEKKPSADEKPAGETPQSDGKSVDKQTGTEEKPNSTPARPEDKSAAGKEGQQPAIMPAAEKNQSTPQQPPVIPPANK
ncbi:MAG TPA: hypothetical protein V6D17_06345 [Candidatus Obscuribacterales bacterium]